MERFPFLAILLVLLALAGLLLAVRSARRRQLLGAEAARKTVHIGMGLLTLSFPWLFSETWPVLFLAFLAIASLLALRLLPAARRLIGSDTLHGVERASLGELYFPLSVALLFALSPGQPLLYLLPVAVLTLADAAGALVGLRYGRATYRTDDGQKSAEGSLAVFLVSFLTLHVPLLLASPAGRAESLLIALTLALAITLMEALSWAGLDNLLVPLLTHVALKIYLHLTPADLLLRLLTLAALTLALLLWRPRTLLSPSAALAAGLMLHASWALGGWPWLVPPVLLLLGYTILCRGRINSPDTGLHPAAGILSVSAAPLLWLFLAHGLHFPELLLPFTLAWAIQMTLVRQSHLLWLHPARPFALVLLQSHLPGLALLLLASQFGQFPLSPARLALPIAAILLAPPLFHLWQIRPHGLPANDPRWWRQALLATALSTFAL